MFPEGYERLEAKDQRTRAGYVVGEVGTKKVDKERSFEETS